jgi:hypothetical protein
MSPPATHLEWWQSDECTLSFRSGYALLCPPHSKSRMIAVHSLWTPNSWLKPLSLQSVFRLIVIFRAGGLGKINSRTGDPRELDSVRLRPAGTVRRVAGPRSGESGVREMRSGQRRRQRSMQGPCKQSRIEPADLRSEHDWRVGRPATIPPPHEHNPGKLEHKHLKPGHLNPRRLEPGPVAFADGLPATRSVTQRWQQFVEA